MKNHVDTVLLDLGGVLIDVDYERTARAFHALGFTDFHRLVQQGRSERPVRSLRGGRASIRRNFGTGSGRLFRPDLTDREIDACWNAMLGTVPRPRLELIAALKRDHQVLLLSNTNAIHVPAFSAIVGRTTGSRTSRPCSTAPTTAAEIGLRKPDAEAFHHVLSRHGADPSRTLFIDDQPPACGRRATSGASGRAPRPEQRGCYRIDVTVEVSEVIT